MSEQKQLERVVEIESQTALAGKFGIRFGIQTSDVAYLLAELRKRDQALERVEAACDRVINNEDGHKPPGPPHPTQQQATAIRIRAAVTGDGA